MFSAVPRTGYVVFCVILVLTCSLYPVLKTLCVQIHSAVTGSYVAGYHSVLLVNCPTEQTARDIGRSIMEKRLAACVNIFPRTTTIAVHPYDIPEIISFPIDDGSQHYLKWMEDAVTDI
ncbi:protein CutA homolog [Sinocyclocheilus anshuiensis]|uniref:protein CutA homolog n=1 Tax=Sinocyclocheilus anshuiensis TaxID=1608454 RepID=UPI0007B89764|nr:PREDICTED: protein CutA homolog [Sinocyclocheilus anshuiensis]